MKKQKTIPIFVPHMGCPNDCSFCNQRKITGQGTAITPDDADEMIQSALKTIPKDAFVEIGFFGGSFTGIEKSLQKQFLQVAHEYIKQGLVDGVRVSTRPDYIDEETVLILKRYGVTTIELGAQSMDDYVLFLNHRGHSHKDTIRASEIIHKCGVALGLQMMTGLYGDTDETCLESAKKMVLLSPSCVRIYPTLVLKETHLAALYEQGVYQVQQLDEAISLCADLKQIFDDANIPVIRMGLLSSDNICPDADVVAGPYHPSFGELVQGEIYFRKLKQCIYEDCTIAVHPRSISAYLGNRKQTITKFKQLGFRVDFVQDETVEPGEFRQIKKKGGKLCV